MIQTYKKVLEMESIASLKLEMDRKALERIRKIMYQDKDFIIDKLIKYLKREMGTEYFQYKVIDIDGNIADILVKKESKIFQKSIKEKDFLNFYVEELINSRMFDNKDEIIVLDFNSEEKLINLGYICDSLNYDCLSYENEIRDKLSIFVDYVINKNICKK